MNPLPELSPEYITPRNGIEHGKVQAVEYPSTTVGVNRRMMVYTPPSYTVAERYPVLFLLHGIGGDENEWLKHGSPDTILDNLYADGKIKPMIVVFPNGRAQINDRAEGDIFAHVKAFEVFEKDLLVDIIPFLESHYPVLQGAGNRAIAGFSMGAGQSLNIGFANLETFAWIGAFAPAPNTKAPEVLYVDSGNALAKPRLLWLSCGDQDSLIEIGELAHLYFDKIGLPHIWHVHPGGHDCTVWSKDLAQFSQLIFRS